MTPAALVADTLSVFIPTRLVNPTNERSHWSVRSKRAKAQRDAVAMAVWYELRHPHAPVTVWRITAKPETPKRISFIANVARKMDSDGLQASLKSVRDGLQDCGLIHHDGPDSGHTFDPPEQRVAKPLGVTITVTLEAP